MNASEELQTRDLERRLAESEATIQALLSGQIDAVVDPGSQTPLLLSNAQAALRKSEERYRRIVETTNEGIWTVDIDSRVTFANRRLSAMLGYAVEEMLGKPLSQFLPEAAGAREAHLQRVGPSRQDTSAENEVELVRKDGSVVWVILRSSPIRDTDGTSVGTLAMLTDRTRSRQAEQALRKSEERIRFALEAAGVGIWDMDYTTGVHQWSETLEAHYGLQPGTFGGTFEAFVERIHPDDRESVIATVEKAMKSGTDFSVLNRTIWPDGSVRWLSGAGRVVLGQHGEPLRAIGISMDVTDRHTLEEQFQQAQKMEAIGRLAGGVAHDFNNLLTVILGFCELLLADGDLADPRQADIAEIQKAGMSAAGLTRQLLAFSRKQIIEPTRLDLNVLVADMRAMLERLIGENVTVVLSLRPALACAMADRGQAEQILMNLAVNARDAMPQGGTLTIETANVDLDEDYARKHLATEPGAYVALTVTDSGTGMTPEVKAQLFEPFFTTKERGKGTGLGLATVYGIAKGSGGSVTVESEVGKGTSFTVYFPQAGAVEAVVPAPTPVERPRGGTQTVLVVEDEEAVRELVRRMLRQLGYAVLLAASADEAVQLVERNSSIDVLLSDVVMLGRSGPQLASQLVEQRPTLRVIYMSGYTDEAIVQHGVLKPGIAFLHKPFTAEALGQKLREVLDR